MRDRGVEFDVVEYLKHPPDRATIRHLVDAIDATPQQLVRNDPKFKALGLDHDDFTTKRAVVDLLAEHPEVMQRPIAVRGDRAVIGRPVERILELV